MPQALFFSRKMAPIFLKALDEPLRCRRRFFFSRKMAPIFLDPQEKYFWRHGPLFWTHRPIFHDFLKTKKMRSVRTINLAVLSRRDLCYVSENEGFCFGQNIWISRRRRRRRRRATDEPSDPNLTPLPTHPGIKYVARALAATAKLGLYRINVRKSCVYI